ncbi:MAG: hypothetical protein MZV70_01605 [Desulfobacterales bacterium]|nr:hypothetical protein [Desulfobacterales bacterium]
MSLKEGLFRLFGLDSKDGLVFSEMYRLNTFIHESHSKFGILGFALLIPLIFKYSFSKLTSAKNRSFYIAITGLFTLGFIFVMAIAMGFLPLE